MHKHKLAIRVLLLLLLFTGNQMAFSQIDSQMTFEECLLKLAGESSRFGTLENLELLNRSNLRIQQTALFPSIGVSGSYNLFVQNSTISYNENVLPPSTILNARSTALSGSVTVGTDLVQLGQTAFQARATRHGNEALSQEYAEQKNAFLQEATRLYSDCIISKQTIEQLGQQAEVSLELLRVSEAGLYSGRQDSTEFLQAKINAEKDRLALMAAELDWMRLQDQLKVYLKLNDDTELFLETLDDMMERVSLWEANIHASDAIRMQAMEFRWRQAVNMHRANYFSFVPSLTVYGGYSISDQRFQNGIFAQNKGFGPTYGLSLNYSFGQVKNAFHQHKITALSLANSELELEAAFLETQMQRKHLRLTIVQLQEELSGRYLILQAARRTQEIRVVAYKSGKTGIREVREAQLERMGAEVGLHQAKAALILAKLEEMALRNDLESVLLTKE